MFGLLAWNQLNPMIYKKGLMYQMQCKVCKFIEVK